MKTKAIVPLLIILLNTLIALPQQYHPLLNEDFYWDIATVEPYICWGYSDWPPYRYMISGDTVINNTVYKKFDKAEFYTLNPQPAPNCPPFAVDTIFIPDANFFLREDTVEKKVWRYISYENEEVLLYDFNLQPGDTFSFPLPLGSYIVDTVYDIITFDGEIRKKIEFEGIDYYLGGYCIEGIGGAGGLFYPFYFFETGTAPMCVKKKDGFTVWLSEMYFYDCYDFISGIKPFNEKPGFDIFPNPATSGQVWIRINNPGRYDQVLVRCFDAVGNCVYSSNNTKTTDNIKLDISGWPSGIYFMELTGEGMPVGLAKFVVRK